MLNKQFSAQRSEQSSKANVLEVQQVNQSFEQGKIRKSEQMREEIQFNYFQDLLQQIPSQDLLEFVKQLMLNQESKILKKLEEGNLEIVDAHDKKMKNQQIEEVIMKKQMHEMMSQKQSLESQLKKIDTQLDDLKKQKQMSVQHFTSHPIFKEFVQQEEDQKKAQTSDFLQKIKQEKMELKSLKQKVKEQIKLKELQEIQKRQQDDLTREEELNQKKEIHQKKIEDIKMRQDKRLQEMVQFEENYRKQLQEKIQFSSEQPLYKKLQQEYKKKEQLNQKIYQEKLNEISQKKNVPIDLNKLKEHELQYLEKMKNLEQQRQKEREDKEKEIKQRIQQNQLISQAGDLFDYKKKMREEWLKQHDSYDKEAQIARQRKNFTIGFYQQRGLIKQDQDKELELQIRVDKLNNPRKYIKQVKKNKGRNVPTEKISDEQIYKQEVEVPGMNLQGKQKELGTENLKAMKAFVKKCQSEKSFATNKSMSIDAGDRKLTANKQLPIIEEVQKQQQQQPKRTADYLKEMRKKYNLEGQNNNWEKKINKDNLKLEDKNKILMREVEKLDAKVKERDQINKNDQLKRYKQDEMDQVYYNSIKAKLKFLDINFSKQISTENNQYSNFN